MAVKVYNTEHERAKAMEVLFCYSMYRVGSIKLNKNKKMMKMKNKTRTRKKMRRMQ